LFCKAAFIGGLACLQGNPQGKFDSDVKDKWQKLVDEFGEGGVLIVSNTVGAAGEEEQVYNLKNHY